MEDSVFVFDQSNRWASMQISIILSVFWSSFELWLVKADLDMKTSWMFVFIKLNLRLFKHIFHATQMFV